MDVRALEWSVARARANPSRNAALAARRQARDARLPAEKRPDQVWAPRPNWSPKKLAFKTKRQAAGAYLPSTNPGRRRNEVTTM